ncbi:MAG: hypothetical protein R2883_01930 [Caldisericia bacterium]
MFSETHIYDDVDLTAQLGQKHIGKNMSIVGVDIDGCFAEYITVPEKFCGKMTNSRPLNWHVSKNLSKRAAYAVLGEDNDVYGKTSC